jgi:hypothetical protein
MRLDASGTTEMMLWSAGIPIRNLPPSASPAIGDVVLTRRQLLVCAAAMPMTAVFAVRQACPGAPRLVQRNGWLLRADDLARLGIA